MSYIKHYIIPSKKGYALLNYEEIITYYKLPFYKKWFKSAPIKEMMELPSTHLPPPPPSRLTKEGAMPVKPKKHKCLCDMNNNGEQVMGFCMEHKTDWL
jgi:hypothetical protein